MPPNSILETKDTMGQAFLTNNLDAVGIRMTRLVKKTRKNKTKGAKIIIWTEHSITIIKSQMLFLLWWFHRYNPEICVVIKIILCCWAVNDRQTLLICHRGVSYYFCSHCWELRIVYDFLRLHNIPTHVIVDVAPNHLTMK